MDANKYQELAARTLIDKPDRQIPARELAFAVTACHLAIDALMICEMVKKGVFHQHGIDGNDLAFLCRSVGALAYHFDSERSQFEADLDMLPLSDRETMLLWFLTGLLGEAGEIASLVLAGDVLAGDVNGELPDELGDLMWYLSAIATKRGSSLSDILGGNIEKLMKRYPEGYRAEDSLRRVDVSDDIPDNEPARIICPECGANIPNDGNCWYCENKPVVRG